MAHVLSPYNKFNKGGGLVKVRSQDICLEGAIRPESSTFSLGFQATIKVSRPLLPHTPSIVYYVDQTLPQAETKKTANQK